MKYKIIKTWQGEIDGLPVFGYETEDYIVTPTEWHIPKYFKNQAVLQVRDKSLNIIKTIGSDSLTFQTVR